VQGTWTCFVPDATGGIPHNSHVKASVVLPSGERVTRLPAWIRYATYDKALNEYVGRAWFPSAADKHVWVHSRPRSDVAACDYTKVGLATRWLRCAGCGQHLPCPPPFATRHTSSAGTRHRGATPG